MLPVDLLAHSLKELVDRTGIDPVQIDDVIAGAVTQVGDQAVNIARNAVLAAGFPESVPGTTVDRQCGSSQQAISFAAQGVISGAYDIVGRRRRRIDGAGADGLERAAGQRPVRRDGAALSRRPCAARHQRRADRRQMGLLAAAARRVLRGQPRKGRGGNQRGRFDNELVPINGLATDEIIRPGTTVETLAGLKPAFYTPAYEARFPQIKWEITPGNSSPLSDGSAAVLITTSEVAKRLGLRPLARIHTATVVGSDPLYMLTGVIPATEKVLQRAGLTLADIDLFEVNEAFAPVVMAWAQDTGADLAKTNVNGGAIAIGHPLGASGARIMTTMVNALEQRGGRYGLQTMCEAGGMANATIIERL